MKSIKSPVFCWYKEEILLIYVWVLAKTWVRLNLKWPNECNSIYGCDRENRKEERGREGEKEEEREGGREVGREESNTSQWQ